MSLYRQMWLTVIACMVLAFAASLAVSLHGARATVVEQLEAKDADGAAALAMSMSQLAKDGATLELQAASLFEEGRYASIRVRDREGRMLVELVDSQATEANPEADRRPLLAALLPIEARPGTGEITDGPVRFGSVELASRRDSAYARLDAIAWRLLGGFALAAVLAGLLSGLVLRRLRRPLQAVMDQARAISERRFVTIEEPRVPELRSVVRALNQMVQRVRTMFEEESARLEQMRHAANHDALTGLANREYFQNRLAGALDAESASGPGLLVLLRLRNLAGINRKEGRAAADALLLGVAQVLAQAASAYQGALAGRLNGADFAMILPDGDPAQVQALHAQLAAINLSSNQADGCGAIAAARFAPGDVPAEVLARADAALAQAELDAGGAPVFAGESHGQDARPAAAWRAQLTTALADQRLQLVSYPVRRFDGELLHGECFARIDLDKHGEWLPAARFMPQVARLDLSAQFDLAVAQQVLETIGQGGQARALNLSAHSLSDPQFVPALVARLERYGARLPQLWVDLPDDAFRHFDALAELALKLRERGCRVGLERFGRDFSHVAHLQDLRLDYVKIDAGFIHGIAHSEGNRRFVGAACAMLKGLGCLVIADGVRNSEDLQAAFALGVDAAGGPAVREQEQVGQA